jgi:peptidoglycan/LPS O-acetylase OafA/YrhL
VYVCTACLVSVLVGVAAHLWMEKPMTRYLNGVVERRWKRRQGGAIQPA